MTVILTVISVNLALKIELLSSSNSYIKFLES